MCGNEQETCQLTETEISGKRNSMEKETEKELKYKNLTADMQRVCSVETELVPVMVGASGTISNSFAKYLNVPGMLDIKELQKTATLGAAHSC